MNLSLNIAKRYLFAKKSHNAINIITLISVIVVAVGATAMIVILSVFNGLEGLISGLYSSYTPDLVITQKSSKYIDLKEFNYAELKNNDEIVYYSEVIEDIALLKYTPSHKNSSRQIVAKLKAVPNDYSIHSGIDSMMIGGNFTVGNSKNDFIVLGNALSSKLEISFTDIVNPVHAYYPNQNASAAAMMNPLNAFRIENVHPSGVFSIQQEVDEQLAFVSREFAEKLMGIENKATSIEVFTKHKDVDALQNKLKEELGESFVIKNRKQQNEVMFKIMQSEKWSSFLILSFIMLIATFNIVGSVTVLVIEKKKDIESLRYMGASNKLIKKIFFLEGSLISFFGGIFGLLFGFILVQSQKHFHIIPMQGSFVVDAFPVALNYIDFVLVFVFVIITGIGATYFPLRKIKNQL